MIPGFIVVPIKLVHTDKLTDKRTFSDSTNKILATEVISYRPSIDDDFPDLAATLITCRGGDTFHAYISEEKFESLLEEVLSLHSKTIIWNKHPQ